MWSTERPTKPGWYWFRYNANSKPHATKIELGSYEGDNSGILYCRENSYVPGNACYIKDGEWQPVSPPQD